MTSDATFLADLLASASEHRCKPRNQPSNSVAAEQVMAEQSDESLFTQLREGNQGALALLFRRYARMVRAVALRVLQDAAEAEDLVQEVFLLIFRKSTLFDPSRGSGRAWLAQVTYHRAIDRRRHLASRGFYTSGELDESTELRPEALGLRPVSPFLEATIEGALGAGTLEKIEAELTPDQRRTLELYFFEGCTFDEIAERTGHAVGNVRNHYYRALERIRKLVLGANFRRKLAVRSEAEPSTKDSKGPHSPSP
jgi:RNA polymerase sigma-70 factor, ECF subfamily